jgi:predicted nucleic acid-binding protein
VKAVLLDTNVISELVRPTPEARVIAFVQQQKNLWLSSITIHELSYGAERAPDTRRRSTLIAWVADIKAQFSGRIVDIDTDVAEQAGQMRASAAAFGITADPMDALIAACAAARGADLATRNTRDFGRLGVPLINPWGK